MHLHDIRFLPLDRRPFNVEHYNNTGEILYTGPAVPVGPGEAVWKDTWNCYPGYVNRVVGTFEDYTGIYMDHCHILEHEENEMMRPFIVMPSDYSDIGFELTSPTIGCGPGAAQFDTLRLNSNREGMPFLDMLIQLPAGIEFNGAGMLVEPEGAARDPNLYYVAADTIGGGVVRIVAVWNAPYSSNDPQYRFADIPLRYAGAQAGTHPITGMYTLWLPEHGGEHYAAQHFVNELLLYNAVTEVTNPCDILLVVQAWNGGQDVRLTWTAYPGATSYRLHYDTVPDGPFTNFITVQAPDTFAILPANDPSLKQFYRVVAVTPER